jgi:Ca2+-binding RTX toxin-like protein
VNSSSLLSGRSSAPRRSGRRARRLIAGTGVSVILAAGVLASAGLAVAAQRPKAGPCVVSAGVTYSVRNTVVTGTTGEDTIDCSASRKSVTIIGRGGGDHITGSKGGDVIYGGEQGTPAGICTDPFINRDDIDGGLGNDDVHGSVCGSSSRGGAGDDQFTAGGGSNNFRGDEGNDTIDLRNSGPGANASGGAGNDAITGPETGMDANGDDGNDVLIGGAGVDELVGMAGDDTLEGGGGNDGIDGGLGIDHLVGGDGDDNLIDFSSDADFFIGGSNATTTPPLPRPGAWGDVCADSDGQGTAPGDPAGDGAVGNVSGTQNDSIDGCEYVSVSPTA